MRLYQAREVGELGLRPILGRDGSVLKPMGCMV